MSSLTKCLSNYFSIVWRCNPRIEHSNGCWGFQPAINDLISNIFLILNSCLLMWSYLNLEDAHDRKLMFTKYNVEETEIKGELSFYVKLRRKCCFKTSPRICCPRYCLLFCCWSFEKTAHFLWSFTFSVKLEKFIYG